MHALDSFTPAVTGLEQLSIGRRHQETDFVPGLSTVFGRFGCLKIRGAGKC